MPPAPGQNRIFRSGEELGQGPLLLHGLDHVGHLGLVSHQDHAAQPAAGEVVPLQIALDVVPDLYGLIGGAGDLARVAQGEELGVHAVEGQDGRDGL